MTPSELHFERAPIVEALIAIDLASSLGDDAMRRIEAASRVLQEDYPDSQPLRQLQIQLGFVPAIAATQQHDASFGAKLVSGDKRQLVVFRRNGFSFSRLPPYQRWQTFRDEARRLWVLYRDAAGELRIVRFGLRYINRLNIPVGRSIADYLSLYPELPSNPDGSLRTVNSSYMRVDSILTEIPEGRLIIQQATLPPESQQVATFSLDFDISVAHTSGITEDQVWSQLELARHIKNDLFVSSLKPDFLETFR